jgi:GT2 family glycosyltransferase
LRQRLAVSSTGWRHLAQAGALCLGLGRGAGDPSERARLTSLAAELVLWAWGENPLSGPLAAEILSAPELPLPEASRAGLAAVAANWRVPDTKDGGLAYFERLAKQRDTRKLADFLAVQVKKAPTALFWREKALALALYAAEPDLRAALEAAALDGLDDAPALAPVAGTLQAQAAFLRGDTTACLDALGRLDGIFGPGFGPGRAGLALLAAGDEPAALAHLLRALTSAPWQANLAQVAADAASGLRRECAPLPGTTLIMLYTWNKATDLDATLASLFASDLQGARVLVLDNGSTDHTPQMLDAWAARAGGNLLRMTLPVNIGAPAARNWLAATPEAKAADFLVFLDDDVDLPRDWLLRLGAAQRLFPEAGVWGCKVADHHAPHLLQNVAGHLVIPADAPDDRPDLAFQSLSPNPFRLCDAHLQGPDWGLHDFVSPCASVTGCCHLFRRAALDAPSAAGGGFSLALGPSQYDDFERDLRMLDSGAHAVYTGHLRVRHRKRSGIASQAEAAGAGAAGNRYKMQCLHPRAEIEKHIEAQAARLEAHHASRLALLEATLTAPLPEGQKA